jgi:uncharacterized protein YfaS (alpha-2-macroglobulin family)
MDTKQPGLWRSSLFFLFLVMAGFTTQVQARADVEIDYVGVAEYQSEMAIAVMFKAPLKHKYKVDRLILLKDTDNNHVPYHYKLTDDRRIAYLTKLEVGQTYTLNFQSRVLDKGKYNDKDGYKLTLHKKSPSASFIGKGPVAAYKINNALPIETVNLNQVDLEYFKVTELGKFISQAYYSLNNRAWKLDRLTSYFAPVEQQRFTIKKNSPNISVNSSIPLPKALTPGWYVVVLKPVGLLSDNNHKIQQVLVTNTGIQAKVFAEEITLSATQLDTGKPQRNAKYTIWGKDGEKASGFLDEHGVATIDYQVIRDDVVIVETNDDMAILPLKEVPLDLSDFAVSGRNFQALEAFIYSNRDLIAPGESLPINILLRDSDGRKVQPQPLFVELITPVGNVIKSWSVNTRHSGYYQTNAVISKAAKLGRWHVNVKSNPQAKTVIASFNFQVQEFKPERMALTLTADQQFTTQDQAVNINIQGRYLFGSPASKNTVTVQRNSFYRNDFPGKIKGYRFGNQSAYLENSYQQFDNLTLSDEGIADFNAQPLAEKIAAPVQSVYTFGLQEKGGATVSRAVSYTQWPSPTMPAIKPLFEQVGWNKDAEFELALYDVDQGSFTRSILQLNIYRNSGGYYWTYSDSYGWELQHNNDWEPVQSRSITVTDSPQNFKFNAKWGDYRIELKDPRSGMVTSHKFYAGWGSDHSQTPVKPEQLNFALDKTAYQNGDTAKLTVNAPFAGSLLIAVEADATQWYTSVDVTAGKQSIDIPVKQDYLRHDLYISAQLTGLDKRQHSKRALGVLFLPLDRDARRLTTTTLLPNSIEPNSQQDMQVQVVNADTNTWVTLSLVDKGIINLARFTPADGFDYLFGQRAYQTDILDLYSRLYSQTQFPFASRHVGGDGVDKINNKAKQQKENKTFIYMSQPVKVDADGVASFNVAVPDYNGEVQVIATAFNDEMIGDNVSDLTVKAPLVAELATPDFVTPGDKSQVTVELFNLSGDTGQFDVQLSASAGITFTDDLNTDEFNTNKFNTKITLENNERKTWFVPFTTNGEADLVTFELTVNGQQHQVKRSWRMPIRQAVPVMMKSELVTLQPGESWQADSAMWQGLSPYVSQPAVVQISHGPQFNVQQHSKGLLAYPYGCVEQTTSKALVWLLDEPALDKQKQALLKSKKRTENDVLANAIQRLSQMQRYNGGFNMWSKEYGGEKYWLTVYVTDFLYQLNQKHPNLVPEKMLSSATQRIKKYLTGSDWYKQPAVQTYAAYVLVKNKQANWSDISALADKPLPSNLAKTQLAAAFLQLGDQKQYKKIMAKDMHRAQHFYADYGSDIRDKSQQVVILAGLQANPALKNADDYQQRISQLLTSLLHDTNTESWFSTQENIGLLGAGIEARKLNNKPVSLLINASGTTALTAPGVYQQVIDLPYKVTNQGDESVLLQRQAFGYPLAETWRNTIPTKQAERQYFYPDGSAYNGEPVAVGQRLIVTLSLMVNENVHNAMLVDMLPAGFSIINPELEGEFPINNLTINDRSVDKFKRVDGYKEYRRDRYVASFPLLQQPDYNRAEPYLLSYQIRAEVIGNYSIPPVYVEDMYQVSRQILQPQKLSHIQVIK